MKTTHISVLLSFILVASFGISPAFATPVIIGFDGAANGGFTGPVDEDGFTYSLLSGALFATTIYGNPPPEMEGSVFTNGGILKIVSSTPNEAFNWLGFDIAEWDTNNLDLNQITVEGFLNGTSVGLEQFTPTQAAGQGPFSTQIAAGALLGTTIDELRITLPADLIDPNFNNFFYARTDNIALDKMIGGPPNQPVPEPGTIFLFGSGLGGLALWRYRKNTVKA